MLRKFATRRGHVDLPLQVEAKDFMDDGTPICLHVTVDPQEVSVSRNPGAGRGLGCRLFQGSPTPGPQPTPGP